MTFLTLNWISILIIILVVLYISFLVATKQCAKLREIALGLMLTVERNFKDDVGADKFNIVFKALYVAYIPKWMKFLVSEKQLKVILQTWYDNAKVLLQVKEKRIG